MNESVYTPKGLLSRFIQYFWMNDGYEPQSAVEKVLPSGSIQIIINLEEKCFRHFHTSDLIQANEYDNVILTGMQTGYVYLDSYSRISTIGVVLKKGAVPALFGIPAGEFRDQVVSLRDITKFHVSEWREKLIAAPAIEEKFWMIEHFLTDLLKDSFSSLNPAILAAADQIEESNGNVSISDILDQSGYSRRWFSELFRNVVGVNPKQYAMICRFQNVLNAIRNDSFFHSTDIALRCGYFDQAHFIHDFKQFAGMSPSDYFRNQGTAANHLSIYLSSI